MDKEKILIIQLRRIGDVILTIPVIEALRNNFPDYQIDFLVEKQGAEILKGNRSLNAVHVYDSTRPVYWIRKIKSMKYDYIFDFLSNPRTAVITLLSGAKNRAGLDFPVRGLAYNKKISLKNAPQSLVEFKLDFLRSYGLKAASFVPEISLDENEKNKSLRILEKWVRKRRKTYWDSPIKQKKNADMAG